MRISVMTFRAFCCLSLFATTTPTAIPDPHKLPKFCKNHPQRPPLCRFKHATKRLTCTADLPLHHNHTTTTTLHSCSWSLPFINPQHILSTFPLLHTLVLTNGNVTRFTEDFPSSDSLHTLVLVYLNLRELPGTLFAALKNLRHLDLSHNRLGHVPPETVMGPSLSKVVLTDNPWNCSSDLGWMLDESINWKLAYKNLVQCGGNAFPGKPVYFVMSLIKRLDNDCPTHICSCAVTNIVWDTDRTYLIPVIAVNCSGRGLTHLPESLPANTTTLILSRNNISDLLEVVENKSYRTIADIYLDENRVESIDVLEGAPWLKRFRVLSLRGNKLSQLPVYALDNAFQKNSNMAALYLGNNPWKCDCLFTPEFQHLLIKYRAVVKDEGDIRCFHLPGDDGAHRRLTAVSTKSVCQKAEEGPNPLDVLSAVFASLIFLILAKLLYDYWTFKRTGKLPWIVTKMP